MVPSSDAGINTVKEAEMNNLELAQLREQLSPISANCTPSSMANYLNTLSNLNALLLGPQADQPQNQQQPWITGRLWG